MAIKLDKMNLPDLIQLQKDLEKTIQQKQQSEKISLRERMQELAEQSGFTVEEVLAGKKPGKKRGKVKPKYANPKDKTQVWTGRGRKPKWVEAQLAKGKKMESLLIKK